MGGTHSSVFRGCREFTAGLLAFLTVFSGVWPGFINTQEVPVAKAAEATIDSDAAINGTSHLQAGSQTVFIDDQTGYKFFRDAPGYCVYRKTTDGGATWSATTTVDAQVDCIQITVWYDRWTPGDTGTSIHIATLDTNPDDVWYNRLDTDSDSLLMGSAPVSMTTGQGGTITEGGNLASITKGTDGTIYASNIDGSDSYVVECSGSCNLAGSWSETGTNPFGLTTNYAILAPLPDGDILAIHRDIAAAAEDMGSKVWDNTGGTWDVATTTFDSNAPDNTTYDAGMAFTVSPTTGDVYLAYIARNTALGNDDQIRTAVYSGGSWTVKKEVVRYSEYGITNVAISLDASNDDVYVAYSARTLPAIATSSNVYWRKSADGMDTWTYEEGPVNSSPNDIYGVDLNTSNTERIYASWFENTGDDIVGDTIADIHPGIQVTTVSPEGVNDTDSYTQIAIDSNASIAGTSHIMAGSQTVFTDDQTGYKFFVDAPGYCVYRKTTDGGSSWGATTTVDAQVDCLAIQVWYDRWTPGDTGDYIHIATLDGNPDDVWYNRLDTNGDTLLMGSAPVSGATAQGGTIAAGTNQVSITKGTDGTIYMSSIDASDSYVVKCSANCNLAVNWSEAGTNPFGLTNNYAILVPLSGGNIMAVHRDVGASAENIESKVYDSGTNTWDAASTTIDGNAPDNATYDVGMAVAVSSTTGDVYLAYIARNATPGTDDQIRTAIYSGGSWTLTTEVVSATVSGLTNVAIALDASNDDVYVAYSAQGTANSANTANVLWRKSTDNMSSWGFEQGPVNTTSTDIYGVNLNSVSSDRIYASWFNNVSDDVEGATIIDLPSPTFATLDGQVATVNASTSDVYIGGTFVIYNTDISNSYDVTGITITENGSIDASNDIANVKLFYELDTSSPYTCTSESYGGSESQFGSTDTNGFSGADGVSSFSGSTVSVSETSSLCVYVVFDVEDSAPADSTIEILIQNPAGDITVTGGTAGPVSAQDIPDATTVYNDAATLIHYHWRNDDGSESIATSKTGGVEDTSLTSMRQGSTTRLRVAVSNEGNVATPAMQYRIEYAPNPSTCDVATGWTDVGGAGGDFDMANSSNLTEGADTTNIAEGIGGVTDENITFVTPNGGVRDTSSQTGDITLTATEFVELEYSIVASTTATEGNTYCFRVTDQGNPLFAYTELPRANISADVLVTTATSSQHATTSLPATDYYIGSAFVITENVGSRDVTSITITENGTVDAEAGLDNIELRYDLDVTTPYNCAGESYGGSEAQFGATDTDGFSGPNGTSTFTGTVTISTTSTMCLYVVLDTTPSVVHDETVNIIMESPSSNVLVSGDGSVSPGITRDMNGSTTFIGAVLTQIHYHWRADNGDEVSATSLTSGAEDTPVINIAETTPVRLRTQISNEGGITSASRAFTLEYGAKISTCDAVGTWTNVGDAGGAFDMYDSVHITEGDDTTDISNAGGGVTNENTTFITPNSAIKDTSATVASTTLTSSEYIELEFSIQQTVDAGFDIPYCFRVSTTQVELNAYSVYPELRTAPERDFEIQRLTREFATNSLTLTAGVDYIAPSASTSAFVRITNSHHTGAGDSSAGGTQNADDVTAYILDPSNIATSFTIQRPAAAIATTTHVSVEIIEFIGEPGSDNEMIVRGQGAVTYVAGEITATTSVMAGIADDADVVVFITGVGHPDTLTTNYNSMQSTSAWLSSSDQAVFTRGISGSDATVISYAVVEFTGTNWAVQRSEHTYTSAGTTETEAITALNSLSHAFVHAQKRIGNVTQGDEFGHEVWLSSVGQVSYFLQTGAATPSAQTSVAWIIENTQTTAGEMNVTRTNNTLPAGTPEPSTFSVDMGTTLSDITNASIFINNRSADNATAYPRPIIGATIASTTHYELWRSDTGTAVSYRTEIVEWPTAGLALKQTHYRLYVDNNELTPAPEWPAEGGGTLGEDTSLTAGDNPLGEGERIRIRLAIQAQNATLPAGTRAFKLQYGQMTISCSAVSEASWTTLGDSASSTIWRGYNATGTADGTALPSTLIISSDVAGTLEEANDTDVNANSVQAGDEIEYDWIVEQNGATAETDYCFRMVESDGTPLDEYSSSYPQIRTASFTPRSQNWRWYDDEGSETPTIDLGNENVAPADIPNGEALKLRVTVSEIKNIARDDVRFKLQYSEYANFTIASDVVATTTCTATSTWCYANGGGVDNAVISTALLSDADACVAGVGDGCGTHNESPDVFTGFRHEASASTEYEFTIQSAGPRVNRVYYFRLYDVVQDTPVPANDGEQYPSLVTEGASMNFTMAGLASTTVIEGVTLDVDTTPTTLPFGVLSPGVTVEGAHRLAIDANGTEGYQIFMTMAGDLMTSGGATIKQVTGTNASPLAWNTGCDIGATSCFGYHTGDDTLDDGSTRFSAIDTYARLSTTTLDEVSYSSQPVLGDTTDVVFRVLIRDLQDAGIYETNIVYISVPIF